MPLKQQQSTDNARSAAPPVAGAAFAPELCKPATTPPAGDQWLHETKWDGYRLLATVARGKVRLWSRNAIEWSAKVPELVAAIESLQLRSAQIDGEMIVLRKGLSDFNALQGRLSAESRSPAIYVLFDLPYADGRSLRGLPLIERKEILAKLLRAHPHRLLRFSRHTLGNGEAAYAAAVAARLEGIVSKRIDSPYVGARNGDWVKVKARPSDEFIVVGFTEPKGSRNGIGALLLALPVDGELKYVGRVGTGLSDQRLLELRARLQADVVEDAPADIALMARKDRALALWVKPRLVVEVFHQGIGGQGLLRQPAFKAIRADKTPADLGARKKSRQVAHATARKPAASRTAKALSEDTVRLTHPERVVFAQSRKTKGDIADYYRAVARWMLPEIAGRPLSILRCPAGVQKACFFQKHLAGNLGRHVHGVMIRDSAGRQEYLRIDDEAGLVELVQMNVIEFHPWGARADGGIAMPLAWSQLGKLEAADEFTIANAVPYLSRRRKDPWDGIDDVVQALPKRGRSD
jgi:bifunctional non-homologous end joining protein LigD